MKKRILITGASGFIGRYLCEILSNQYQILGIDIKDQKADKRYKFIKLDICNFKKLMELFDKYNFDIVIHSAAAKHLVWCERNRDKSYQTNFVATKNLYGLAKQKKAKFIFVSSDQVFDGKGGNYHEASSKHPINHYGTLKDLCEEFLIEDKGVAICRTAMVFGNIPDNQKKLFNKIKEKEFLIVQGYIMDHLIYRLKNKKGILLPEDEFCNPTSTNLFSKQIITVIEKNLTGILHCCGGERVSRFEFGKTIARLLNLNPAYIDSSPSNDILRPKDVSMKTNKTEKLMGFNFPKIKQMINEVLEGK